MINLPLFIHFEHEKWKPIILKPEKYEKKAVRYVKTRKGTEK